MQRFISFLLCYIWQSPCIYPNFLLSQVAFPHSAPLFAFCVHADSGRLRLLTFPLLNLEPFHIGFTFETPTAKAWDQQQEDDVADDWDVDEDQVQPQSSAAKSEPEPAAAAVPAKGKADTKDDKAGQQKMTKLAKQRQEQMLAMQKAKAEQAEREREAAARRARLEEEERQRRKDPNYLYVVELWTVN